VKDETKQVLAMLDDLFSDHREERVEVAREVWDVLSALRGPDTGNGHINTTQKDALTVPIRQAAFPKTTAAYTGKWQRERLSYDRPLHGQAMFAPSTNRNLDGGPIGGRVERFKAGINYDIIRDSHYIGHILRAARVLGI
jgi:hypothetical protein